MHPTRLGMLAATVGLVSAANSISTVTLTVVYANHAAVTNYTTTVALNLTTSISLITTATLHTGVIGNTTLATMTIPPAAATKHGGSTTPHASPHSSSPPIGNGATKPQQFALGSMTVLGGAVVVLGLIL